MIIDKNKYTHNNKYAHMAFQGDGIPVDKKEAAKYFKIVADNGSLDSTIIYIKILLTGDGIEPDKMQAARYIKMMSDKIGTKKTQEMLSPIFSELNEKNNDKSNQMDIFSISAETKVCIDDKSIFYYYKKWADEGDIEYTEICLNTFLSGAVGIPKDIEEAKRYLKILADYGNIYYILTYLGVHYQKADLFDEEFHKYCQVVETKGSADQINILADWMKEFDKIESARLFKIAENSK